MHVLDLTLSALLILALPGYMLWRSFAARGKPPEEKIKRYARSMVIAAALDVILTVQWLRAGRSPKQLGLDFPVSQAGLIGLGIAICILVVIAATMLVRPSREANSAESQGGKLLPETRVETIVFVVLAIELGCSWEVLYRGFLLWALSPILGLTSSVLIAAGAYGVAHGFKGLKSLILGLASALVFTVAFAVTRSLWWLMLVHCGLPLVGALAFHRRLRPEQGASPLKSSA